MVRLGVLVKAQSGIFLYDEKAGCIDTHIGLSGTKTCLPPSSERKLPFRLFSWPLCHPRPHRQGHLLSRSAVTNPEERRLSPSRAARAPVAHWRPLLNHPLTWKQWQMWTRVSRPEGLDDRARVLRGQNLPLRSSVLLEQAGEGPWAAQVRLTKHRCLPTNPH